jgi:hypothetical protein
MHKKGESKHRQIAFWCHLQPLSNGVFKHGTHWKEEKQQLQTRTSC